MLSLINSSMVTDYIQSRIVHFNFVRFRYLCHGFKFFSAWFLFIEDSVSLSLVANILSTREQFLLWNKSLRKVYLITLL